jgi:uncharacterized RDD family membrane protein YckC
MQGDEAIDIHGAGTVATVTAATGTSSGIVTPEAVLLEFSEAGLGSRSLAFLVDLGVRAALLYAVLFVLGAAGFVLDETVIVVALAAAGFAIVLVYPVVWETIWNGRTPGKMLIGLRVVTVEGAPVRFRHAAIRSGLGLVDFLVGAGAVAILTVLVTRRNQRLGDLAAGTIVLRERQAAAFSQPIVFRPPPGWGPFASSLDVAPLGDDAYVLVRSFLLRVTELRDDARRRLAGELATLVADAVGVRLPPGTDAEAFLVAVAAAYQVRHGGPVGSRPAAAGATPAPVWAEDEPPPTWGTTASAP